jgi:phage tail-like protein
MPAARHDPLRTYRFRVLVGEQVVAGMQKVSGLGVAVTPRETWEGGNALHRYANPDKATWDPVTLHQGLALGRTLEDWAMAAVTFLRTGAPPAGVRVKRNVVIEVLNQRGPDIGPAPVRYLLLNAWVSRYEAVPALDALANEIALMSVELTHEGWVREVPPPSPVPPTDPSRLGEADLLRPIGNTATG